MSTAIRTSDKTRALESSRSELIRRLEGVTAELFASRCDDADIHIGDLVKHKATVFKVSAISFWGYAPSLEGYKQRKDGAFGIRAQYLGCEWEKVPPTGMQKAMNS